MKGLPYEVKTLIQKARESAILAVETYNRPTASFRSGAYVVLMIIAWTALFHAIFFKRKIKPFYRGKNSNRYIKIDKEPKRWELQECLNVYYKSDNPPIRRNLEFFVGLRNKIEHCSLAKIDPAIFGECQAMLLNFESMIAYEFSEKYVIRGGLTFALQFSKIPLKNNLSRDIKCQEKTFKTVKNYIDSFRSSLSVETNNSLEYSFKVYLVPKISNNYGNDAVAIEWVKYDPSKPDEMKQYERVVAMIKPKEISVTNLGFLKPGKVSAEVAKRLGKRFTTTDHAKCYYHFNIRPHKGADDPSACDTRYCQYDALHKDYCYRPEWVIFLVEKLKDLELYSSIIKHRKIL